MIKLTEVYINSYEYGYYVFARLLICDPSNRSTYIKTVYLYKTTLKHNKTKKHM